MSDPDSATHSFPPDSREKSAETTYAAATTAVPSVNMENGNAEVEASAVNGLGDANGNDLGGRVPDGPRDSIHATEQQLTSATSTLNVQMRTVGESLDKKKPETEVAPGRTNDALIELLLLSGSRKRFTFSTSTTLSEVVAYVFKEWPEEWEESKPERLEQLRLLHRGHFAPGASTLGSFQTEPLQVTVMHLNVRPGEAPMAPQPTKTSMRGKAERDTHGNGCCGGCSIS